MKLGFKRLLSFLLLTAIVVSLLGYIWARKQYPNYARKFLVFNSWEESSEHCLAQIETAQWGDHQLKPGIVHRRVQLNQSDAYSIPEELWEGLEEASALILTVECWGSKYWPVYRSNPLGWVKEGIYDEKIGALAAGLADLDIPVYLRFNPHMEVPGRYFSWQEYPSIYIDAYRYVHDFVKAIDPKIQMLWAPAGYPGLEEFYPGKAYVDAMSITLISASEKNLSVYPKGNLESELYRRLHRLRFFDHPSFILSGDLEGLNSETLGQLANYQANNPAIYNPAYFDYPEQKSFAKDSFFYGVYDPDKKLIDLPQVNAEHLFTDITQFMEEGFPEHVAEIAERDRDLIITLELHKDSNNVREDQGLEKMIRGVYDPCIQLLFAQLDSFPNRIFLRFPQEMEIPIYRYPWQSKDPKLYIDAYRYFMGYADTALPGAYKVWGPAGDRGSLEWYPGSDQVDYISIAIYGLPDKNITDPTKQERFGQIYRRKSWRMRHAPDPIFITEFGVKGPEDYQRDWLLEAAQTIREAPELVGINYFNMHDVPKAWGDIAPPDWSVEATTYDAFIEAIQAQ